MASARDVVGILFGLSLAGFSIANAGLGMLAPRLIQGASASKLIFTRMFEPHCSIPTIEADIASGDQSYCLEAVGVWDGIDILFLVLGLFVLLYGRIGFTKVGRRSDRRYHVFFAAGAVLFSLAILDRLEFLPVAASSEGLSELSPIAVSPFLIQCIIATVGALMMGGPKYWESEGVEQARNRLDKRRNLADTFRGTFGSVKMSLGSRSGASQRISRSRLLNRDAQLHMRRTTSSSIKVLATCPYCKGGGCTECGNTGTL
ncbi:MAG: hypothetical protein L7U62_02465 [Candidatus Poseidoniaceae archaeon]|nr:hypothetical protein [Candidatus Poseidoniaceae archaeon]